MISTLCRLIVAFRLKLVDCGALGRGADDKPRSLTLVLSGTPDQGAAIARNIRNSTNLRHRFKDDNYHQTLSPKQDKSPSTFDQ